MYGGYAAGVSLFEGFLGGASVAATFRPNFCSMIAGELADTSFIRFCHQHEILVKLGVAGSVMAQIGLDLLVLTQLWKVFIFALDRKMTKNASRYKLQV